MNAAFATEHNGRRWILEVNYEDRNIVHRTVLVPVYGDLRKAAEQERELRLQFEADQRAARRTQAEQKKAVRAAAAIKAQETRKAKLAKANIRTGKLVNGVMVWDE